MSIFDKLPRKGRKTAHINIYSLRNKVHEMNNLLTSDNLHILAISETQLINLMIQQWQYKVITSTEETEMLMEEVLLYTLPFKCLGSLRNILVF
jgi:hypothetical protein